MRIIERIDGPDNGDGSKWVKLRFEHDGKVCEWLKTVRLYPAEHEDATKLPWHSLRIRTREAYRDITGDMAWNEALPDEHVKEWFPELS